MSQPLLMLLVRVRSSLPHDEIVRVMEERAPEFAALGGLQQKYYIHDPASGEYGGLYLWESAEALEDYRESELRATIAAAYQAIDEPRVEVYRVIKTLREESP
jgi:heme-degrading monooxygenase HmoA